MPCWAEKTCNKKPPDVFQTSPDPGRDYRQRYFALLRPKEITHPESSSRVWNLCPGKPRKTDRLGLKFDTQTEGLGSFIHQRWKEAVPKDFKHWILSPRRIWDIEIWDMFWRCWATQYNNGV